MILKFGARNFYCFKEGIEISLELGNKCPETISKGRPISNLLCVKGANGSGKTNALKALGFLSDFCCNSFNLKPDHKILVHSFFMNDEPIDLFCDFIFKDTQYHYELSLTNSKVVSEKLSRKVNRLSIVFERKGNKLAYCTKEFRELRKVKLRTNASIISSAFQYEFTKIFPVYQFFNSVFTNVLPFGRGELANDYKGISEYYYKYPETFKAAIEFIKEFDLGIIDINISKTKDEGDDEYYYPIFVHDAKVKNNFLTYHSQSLGTQELFRSIPFYLYALSNGGILVMDEFDLDFHPHILQKIVSIFDDEKLNYLNAQMIFSTHNTDILEYMGKYRTVLINKEESESYGYRLDEIPGDIIRNDRLIAPIYNSGKIGGIPRI